MKKNILALQIPSIIGNFEENFKNLENYLGEVIKNKSVDFLFLPEVWSTGWLCDIFTDCADENINVDFLSKIAKKYNINIFGGSFIRKTDEGLFNSCPVISRNGELLGHYDKIHRYLPDGEGVVLAGTSPKVFEIEGLKIGLSICYDIRFPELYRSYINTDFAPDLLVNMAAWPMTRKEQYKKMAASRAIENQSYFLAVSQCGEIKNGIFNSGNSVAYNPMGDTIAELGENKDFIYFSLDTDEVLKTRTTFPNLGNRKVFDFGFKPVLVKEKANVKC